VTTLAGLLARTVKWEVLTCTCGTGPVAALLVAVAARLTRTDHVPFLPVIRRTAVNFPERTGETCAIVFHTRPVKRCTRTGAAARGDTMPVSATVEPGAAVLGDAVALRRVVAGRRAAPWACQLGVGSAATVRQTSRAARPADACRPGRPETDVSHPVSTTPHHRGPTRARTPLSVNLAA
jgi:hypothetical protein